MRSRVPSSQPASAGSAAPRKRRKPKPRRKAILPAQLGLLNAAGTLVRGPRGGRRPGAGRPSSKERPSEPHKRRAAVDAKHPQHVVIRVVPTVGNLRRKHTYRALRRATEVVAEKHKAFRICHISVQRTHVHLLVEAQDRMALARGMQGFQIAAARRLNAAVDRIASRNANRQEQRLARAGKPAPVRQARRGSRAVFVDRYHATAITQPRQARAALAYVLQNWRRHGEHVEPAARAWRIDPFSSSAQFTGWETPPPSTVTIDGPFCIQPAKTWLLSAGWARHGPLRVTERPGPRPPEP